MSSSHGGNAFIPLSIAVLTVSDTRDESNDTSGQVLVERLTEAGHKLADKVILKMMFINYVQLFPNGSLTIVFKR